MYQVWIKINDNLCFLYNTNYHKLATNYHEFR